MLWRLIWIEIFLFPPIISLAQIKDVLNQINQKLDIVLLTPLKVALKHFQVKQAKLLF